MFYFKRNFGKLKCVVTLNKNAVTNTTVDLVVQDLCISSRTHKL